MARPAPLRLAGVVRAARRADATLRRGLAPEDREPFLEGVRRTVGQIHALLGRLGARPEALPGPSRRALADLERIAALDAAGLPRPAAGTPGAGGPATVGISGVVPTARALVRRLAEGAWDADRLAATAREAGAAARAVERICREAGSDPSALARPSGRAYAMLAWLAARENVARYLRQRDRAVAACRHACPAAPPVAVRFEAGRRVWQVRRERGRTALALHVGYLGVDEAALADVVAAALGSGAPRPAPQQRLWEVQRSPAFVAHARALEAPSVGAASRARGHAHDLDALFEELNAAYFGGALERPRLCWHPGGGRRGFGFYLPSLDAVHIDTRLDHADVPREVVAFVLYHELLHKKHGGVLEGSRHRSHTAAFRADEHRFAGWAEAERWLTRRAAGRPPSRPEEAPETGPDAAQGTTPHASRGRGPGAPSAGGPGRSLR